MSVESALILITSTIGLILIGYVVLTNVFRVVSRPALLLPWNRKQTVARLEEQGHTLLSMRLSREDRHAVERALNTLAIPGVASMSGPWSNSDPISDAQRDIDDVWKRVGVTDEQAAREQ